VIAVESYALRTVRCNEGKKRKASALTRAAKKKKPWFAAAALEALLLQALLGSLALETTRGVTLEPQRRVRACSAAPAPCECLYRLPAVCIVEEEECLSARFLPRQARATH